MVLVAKKLIEAKFLQRMNRFVGLVEIDGRTHQVHILNPGRMIEILYPGVTVLVDHRQSKSRKLEYSLQYIKHPQSLILIDSIIPNKLVHEALQQKKIPEFNKNNIIQPEQKYGEGDHSRIDFLLDHHLYLEVKATNYCWQNIGFFPDAPSKRAQKHVDELIKIQQTIGNQAYILFLAQRTDIKEVRPFDKIDPLFSAKLRDAHAAGVKILAFSIKFLMGGIYAELDHSIPVVLGRKDPT